MTRNLPPAHLEAKTPDELRKVMLLNNAKHKKQFHYFDFTYAQGKWHCWYEITTQDLIGLKAQNEDEK
jgi:hypothetical protein